MIKKSLRVHHVHHRKKEDRKQYNYDCTDLESGAIQGRVGKWAKVDEGLTGTGASSLGVLFYQRADLLFWCIFEMQKCHQATKCHLDSTLVYPKVLRS